MQTAHQICEVTSESAPLGPNIQALLALPSAVSCPDLPRPAPTRHDLPRVPALCDHRGRLLTLAPQFVRPRQRRFHIGNDIAGTNVLDELRLLQKR